MSVNSEFDKGIGGKLRGVSTPPPADLWDDIEARLPEERRRRPFAIWWLSGVAALATVVLVGGGHLLRDAAPQDSESRTFAPSKETPETPTTAQGSRDANDATYETAPDIAVAPSATTSPSRRPAPGSKPRSHRAPTVRFVAEAATGSTSSDLRPFDQRATPAAAYPTLPTTVALVALAPPSLALRIDRPADALPTSALDLVESLDHADVLSIPKLAAVGPPAWRWSVRAHVAYVPRVVDDRALDVSGGVAESLSAFNFQDNNGATVVAPPLASNEATLPLGYAAQLAVTSRRGLRLHLEVGGTQTQTSSVTVALPGRFATTGLASTDVMVARRSATRLVLGGGVGYAPRFGRWTPSLSLGAGWVPAREVPSRGTGLVLASADPVLPETILLRQRVFAKAALGIEYALNPKLDLGVDYSLGGLGSAAGVGLRYSW